MLLDLTVRPKTSLRPSSFDAFVPTLTSLPFPAFLPDRKPAHPPYIHFTLQKTNRDTQDVLQYLARTLRVHSGDLTVAGTKDKRGVTTQRVCLKRSGRSLVDVWSAINGCGKGGERSMREVLKDRGERGVRVADCEFESSSFERPKFEI